MWQREERAVVGRFDWRPERRYVVFFQIKSDSFVAHTQYLLNTYTHCTDRLSRDQDRESGGERGGSTEASPRRRTGSGAPKKKPPLLRVKDRNQLLLQEKDRNRRSRKRRRKKITFAEDVPPSFSNLSLTERDGSERGEIEEENERERETQTDGRGRGFSSKGGRGAGSEKRR